MNTRMKEIAERRDYLVAQSELERERAAMCAERITQLFSKDRLNRALKSSMGSVAGFFVLRWMGKKLAGAVGKLAVRVASGFWRRR